MKTHPRVCSRSVRLAVLPLVVASLQATVVSAQNAPGGGEDRRRRGGEGGGDRGGDRGGFNPQEMQARMLAGLRERMEVKDDEEWKLISERITKVAELRRSAPGGPGMGMMMGRGPGGGGGPGGSGREEGGSGRGGSRPGGGSAEMTALASALRDKLPDAEIKSRLDRLRDQRKDSEAKLARAQEELRAVLTMRQEAMAVMAGLLP
ncbi:MAG: hypothetical protein FJ397_01975 [Verrucomicrobia bacterium]|nr:hypothetical protein [Verrucomicrobiota bacterium]